MRKDGLEPPISRVVGRALSSELFAHGVVGAFRKLDQLVINQLLCL